MEKILYGDSLEVVFNGALYLARDLHYCEQFLGSGKTSNEAIEDLRQTIKKHNIKFRENLYK